MTNLQNRNKGRCVNFDYDKTYKHFNFDLIFVLLGMHDERTAVLKQPFNAPKSLSIYTCMTVYLSTIVLFYHLIYDHYALDKYLFVLHMAYDNIRKRYVYLFSQSKAYREQQL